MMNYARTAALEALLRVDINEGYSNIVIDKTISAMKLQPKDTTLATALFYGVLEKRITLDYVISQFSNTSVDRLNQVVLEILRMAVYQLLYLEKIPKSAAVNEAVNLAREKKLAKASGFINAVLRSLLRGKVTMPANDCTSYQDLSILYSCPEWMIHLWEKFYGHSNMMSVLEALSGRAPIFARVNNTKISVSSLIEQLKEEGVTAREISWLPGAVELCQTGSVSKLESYQKGYFHIQDLSSQICCYLLKVEPDFSVIDVCSAPGGKTFTLAEQMNNSGQIFAFDKYLGKVGLIQSGAERLALNTIQTGIRDAADPKNDQLLFAERVLCDVPCSGLGIIRRKPEIRYKSYLSLKELPALQYLILCKSSELTKPGGILFYTTCTLNPEENGNIADRFLSQNEQYESYSLVFPKEIIKKHKEPENQLTLFPQNGSGDGFFISAFRRKN